jgi:hypothetical protein
MALGTDGGAVTFGFCIPGGFQLPQTGSIVSVDMRLGPGDDCDSLNQAFTVRDDSGALLVHGTSNTRLELPELGTIERVPLCHSEDAASSRRHVTLNITVGSETGSVKAGEKLDIGDLEVTLHRAGDTVYCEGDSECSDYFDVAVVHPK